AGRCDCGAHGSSRFRSDIWHRGNIMTTSETYFATAVSAPIPEADGLDAPYWAGTRQNKLCGQQCSHCDTWQWGPEWICHHCRSFKLDWKEVATQGRIYSWERTWHPPALALKDSVPYLTVLVELPHAGHIRMVGNLLGDPLQKVEI